MNSSWVVYEVGSVARGPSSPSAEAVAYLIPDPPTSSTR